jgi:UDP-glucose 4-epimerase
MSTYLTTGGAGFIGSHLVEALVARGEDVVVLDALSTGSRENLAPFEDPIRLVEGSIVTPATCAAVMDGVDFVHHPAALGSAAADGGSRD